jgi:hypothetical protein
MVNDGIIKELLFIKLNIGIVAKELNDISLHTECQTLRRNVAMLDSLIELLAKPSEGENK